MGETHLYVLIRGKTMKTQLLISMLLIGLIIVFNSPVNARDYSTLTDFCDSLFSSGVKQKMIPGGAVSVVQNGKILIAKGYGYADVENQIPIQANRTLFQIGSVGKVLTAIAVLKLVDNGDLNLDEDIRTYLADLSFIKYFKSPVTLRHLLTHSAGINERVLDYAARTSKDIQTLEQHLEERFPKFFQEPGESISYSNYGYALAGLIVEKVSKISFAQFIDEHILSPLQMHQSTYLLPKDDKVKSNHAKGYRLVRESFIEQPIFYTHTSPAGGLNSTASDMSNLIRMFLNEGIYQDKTILEKESIDFVLSRQFSNHPKLLGYTLGFEEQNIKGYFAVAKGGGTLGFISLLLLIPEKQIGVFITTNVRSDDFIELFVKKFTDEFIQPRTEESFITKIEPVVDLKRFEGVYRNTRYNHHKSIENLLSLFRDRLTVKVTSKGFLTYFPSGNNREYKPVSQLVFQDRNNIHDFIVFKEDQKGKIDGLYINTTFSGMSVPQSYEKVPWFSTPNFINEFYLSLVPMYLLSYILLPLVWLFLLIVRLKKKDFLRSKSMPRAAHLSAFLFALLSIIYTFGYIARLNNSGSSLIFGVPDELIKLNYIPFVLVVLLFPINYFTFRSWSKKSGILLGRLYYSIYLLFSLIFVIFLYKWNFIGFHY
jgi:CubicO group peptidase (beta-lactamase class C family)